MVRRQVCCQRPHNGSLGISNLDVTAETGVKNQRHEYRTDEDVFAHVFSVKQAYIPLSEN